MARLDAPAPRPTRSSPRRRRARTRRDRGAALLSVLLLVTVMSTVAVEITDDIRFAWRRLTATREREQAYWYAVGAETFVREVIRRSWEADPERATLQSPWAGGPTVFPIEGGRLEGLVRDGNNCFNLNSLVSETARGALTVNVAAVDEFRALLRALELDEFEPESLADALVDWLDTDSEASRQGAEDVEYSLQAPPYRPANTLLDDVLELRGVLGYGEEVVRALRPYVCVHPDTAPSQLNVNTLAVEQAALLSVLMGEFFSVDQAVSLLEARPPEGYVDEADFRDALGELTNPNEEPVQAALQSRIDYKTLYFDATARVYYNNAFLELNSQLALDEQTGAVTVLARRFGERDG